MKMHKFLPILLTGALFCAPFAHASQGPGDGVVEPLQTLKTERLKTDLDRTDLITLGTWSNAGFQSLAEVLAGRVPGVQVTGNNFDYRIRVRGALRPPLIVVDQQPFYGRDDDGVNALLQSIPVFDVASINVVKNGGRASIYGPGAANGVIVIQTRGGKEPIEQ